MLTNNKCLKAITTNAPAKRIEGLEPNHLKFEPHTKRYEALAGRPLDEDLTLTELIDACVKKPRDKLEMASTGISCKEERVVLSHIPKGVQSPSSTAPPPCISETKRRHVHHVLTLGRRREHGAWHGIILSTRRIASGLEVSQVQASWGRGAYTGITGRGPELLGQRYHCGKWGHSQNWCPKRGPL